LALLVIHAIAGNRDLWLYIKVKAMTKTTLNSIIFLSLKQQYFVTFGDCLQVFDIIFICNTNEVGLREGLLAIDGSLVFDLSRVVIDSVTDNSGRPHVYGVPD